MKVLKETKYSLSNEDKILKYTKEHLDSFLQYDSYFDWINGLSEEGVFDIPAKYCNDPENVTEEEAERYIDDLLQKGYLRQELIKLDPRQKCNISFIVQRFIEDHIDDIENEDWVKIFNEAYEKLDNLFYKELVDILSELDPDSKKYRDIVLRHRIQEGIDSWIRYNYKELYIPIAKFSRDYLVSQCGLNTVQFMRFISSTEYNGVYISPEGNIVKES